MAKFTRRGFVKTTGVVTAIISAGGLSGLGVVLGGEYDRDWDEAIEENELREEVSRLMDSTGINIEYYYQVNEGIGRGLAVECFRNGKFLGGDIHVRHLEKARDVLRGESVRDGGSRYSTMFIRDSSVFARKDSYSLLSS